MVVGHLAQYLSLFLWECWARQLLTLTVDDCVHRCLQQELARRPTASEVLAATYLQDGLWPDPPSSMPLQVYLACKPQRQHHNGHTHTYTHTDSTHTQTEAQTHIHTRVLMLPLVPTSPSALTLSHVCATNATGPHRPLQLPPNWHHAHRSPGDVRDWIAAAAAPSTAQASGIVRCPAKFTRFVARRVT